jgi:hypothetical protein
MGYPTKVQLIDRKQSEQWYINFPAAIAQAMEFSRGEVVEWIVEDKSQLVLKRRNPPPSAMKKKRRGSSTTSTASGSKSGKGSARSGSGNGDAGSR